VLEGLLRDDPGARLTAGQASALLESQPAGLADLHGLARVFTVTSGGQEYYVQLTALSATWQESQPIFGAFFATFRPGRA
jgi:hypothetical protein